jgi:NADPH:quinone reductase-like Zn-dependent oxidoreductase
MKAIRIHQFGGPEVLKLEEAPLPEIANDDVLIKVHAAAINPVDWKIREGLRKEKFPTTFPLTPGWDVSGVIEAVGENIKIFKKGDEVYSLPDPTRNGAYAEYIAVKADRVNTKPKTIDHINTAAIPLAGLTAWQGLFDFGQLKQGQKVLIHAGAGGVGTFAIQFAKWKGAYVITTASEKNSVFLKLLGANEVIDYNTQKFEDVAHDVDLVLDTLGGDIQKRSLQVLKNGGRLITTLGAESQAEAKTKNIYLENFMVQSHPDQLQEIAQLVDLGKIQPVIEKIMNLEEAAEAQELSKQGHSRGKIVLKIIQ